MREMYLGEGEGATFYYNGSHIRVECTSTNLLEQVWLQNTPACLTSDMTLVLFVRCRPLTPEREKKMFYLTTHSTHFIDGYMASDI